MEIINNKIDTTTSQESSSSPVLPEKSKAKKHTWIFKQTFETAEEAEKNVDDQKIWSVYRKRRTDGGNIAVYRCNKVKRRGEQCNASVKLLYHAENMKVSRFDTKEDHDHEQIESKTGYGISQFTKEAIIKLLNVGIQKPKLIIQNLEVTQNTNEHIIIPTISQLNNYLAYLKRERKHQHKFDFASLLEFCQNSFLVPENQDEPFVVNYQVRIDELPENISCNGKPTPNANIPIEHENFRFLISTKRLLQLAAAHVRFL